MQMMNRTYFRMASAAVAALLVLASCSQDELAEKGTALPYGEYPLEISGVTFDVESSSEPWGAKAPQTRVSENPDGNSSVWEWNGTEKIGVQLYAGDEGTTIYTLNKDKTLTPDKTLYWKDTKQTTVTAWYPAYEGENGTVSLADQSEKLAYVLTSSETGDYNNPVTLGFDHALAKVRVVLQGSDKDKVNDVKINSFTSCTHTQGEISTEDATKDWITMQHIADKGYWEANVVPGVTITKFQINGTTEGTLDNDGITPQEATVNTITLTVGETYLQPGEDGQFTINEGDDVTIKDYEGTAPIVVNGNATITLHNVKLNTSGNVMTINNGATVTLNVKGKNNEFTSNSGAGIKIMDSLNPDHGGSITINGTGASSSKLKVTAASGAAIGFKMNGNTNNTNNTTYSGSIEINKITMEAKGGNDSPAIGISVLEEDYWDNQKIYGNISIDASILTVSSEGGAACIGTPYHDTSSPFSLGIISIRNSTVTATAEGSQAACIGFGYTANTAGNFKKVIQKIEFKNATLHLTTNANNKVGFGDGDSSRQLTEGIWNNESKVGDTGWNP